MSLDYWQNIQAKPISQVHQQTAEKRQLQLTKPPGSLGELESVAVQLSSLQYTEFPVAERVYISIFAADHGVAAQGVSAFPQEVTAQMILNFAEGGAAISVLAKQLAAQFDIVNLGTVTPVNHHNVVDAYIASGTQDFSQTKAMTEAQLLMALEAGAESVGRALSSKAHLYITGEMGIGNTTSAAAIFAALLSLNAKDVVGRGTGVTDAGLEIKKRVIDQALAFHGDALDSPLGILTCVGGFEIAAMTGAYLKAAEQGMPCVIDGFISSVAALLAYKIQPKAKDWFLFGHCSAEQHHQDILQHLNAAPLVNLSMRLGEASGAALAVNVIRAACQLHNTMATFGDAGVSNRVDNN